AATASAYSMGTGYSLPHPARAGRETNARRSRQPPRPPAGAQPAVPLREGHNPPPSHRAQAEHRRRGIATRRARQRCSSGVLRAVGAPRRRLGAVAVGRARYRVAAHGGVSVILREQMDNLGYQRKEVIVRPGYARNYLIPTGKAVYATPPHRAAYKVVLPAAE